MAGTPRIGRERLRGLTRWAAKRSGLRVLDGSFYDPVPDLDVLGNAVFDRVSALPGIELDPAAQLAFAQAELARFTTEFGPGPPRWHERNSYYETGDAEIAYAMVRHLRPARVVELGSGFSTMVLAHALERNRAEGTPARLAAFNPYPPQSLAGGVEGLDLHAPVAAQDVPEQEFAALAAGDVLFVDTSHTVKLGGDVNRIVLEVLPELAANVVVHFHDIWLPYEYHPTLVREMRMYWNEQYLLQAFLSMNPGYEVLFATRAVAAGHPDAFRRLVPGFDERELYPSSFWIRRR